jgi:hypothetical protein
VEQGENSKQNFQIFNPFIFIRNKRRSMSSEGCAAHPVGLLGYIAALQIVMATWRTFFEFEFDGSGVGAAEDYSGCLACFKF